MLYWRRGERGNEAASTTIGGSHEIRTPAATAASSANIASWSPTFARALCSHDVFLAMNQPIRYLDGAHVKLANIALALAVSTTSLAHRAYAACVDNIPSVGDNGTWCASTESTCRQRYECDVNGRNCTCTPEGGNRDFIYTQGPNGETQVVFTDQVWKSDCSGTCALALSQSLECYISTCRGAVAFDTNCNQTCVPVGGNCVDSAVLCEVQGGGSTWSKTKWNDECTGQSPPIANTSSGETCDACDNDGNGLADEGPGGGALTQSCFNPNQCSIVGTQTCSSSWGGCTGCGGMSGNQFALTDGTLCREQLACSSDCSAPAPKPFADPVPGRLWCGGFETQNLQQYENVECGAPSGDGSCPVIPKDEYWGANRRVSDEVRDPLPVPSCVDPSQGGCRFGVSDDPAQPPGTLTGKIGRFVVASGDSVASGERNELSEAREFDPHNPSQPKRRYMQADPADPLSGDDRYYYWKTMFPADGEQGEFSQTTANGAWHSLLQFHHDGQCASPPVLVGLNTDPDCTKTPCNQILTLHSRESQATADEVIWMDETSGGYTPIQNNAWYEFVLHVKWSIDRCKACDPTKPDGGFIEMWMRAPSTGNNWSYLPLISRERVTLFAWQQGVCADDDKTIASGGAAPGTIMGNYLKIGLYREKSVPQPTETVLHADLRTGATCSSVVDDFVCGR